MSNLSKIVSECEKLLRFGTSQLSSFRTKFIAPSLDKMHKSKSKDLDQQFADMDIGKSLAHIEWFFEGEGQWYNPHDLQIDIDADPAGKKTHVHKKRIGDDEYIESNELVPIGQYGFKRLLPKYLWNSTGMDSYNSITGLEQMIMKDQDNLNKALAEDQLDERQANHRQDRINYNSETVVKMKMFQAWIESWFMKLNDGDIYIKPETIKKVEQHFATKVKEDQTAKANEIKKTLGLKAKASTELEL